MQRERCLPDARQFGRLSQSSELNKHLIDIRTDFFVGRHQAKIGVEARSPRMVIAGAQMHIPSQHRLLPFLLLAPHHQRHFGMRLVANHTVDDMRSHFLQPPCPVEIGLFIESRHQFHDNGHFLAVFGGVDQCFHDD